MCYDSTMKTIPHRELRNNSGAVLRQAEAGERFLITVDGRPVAELGPPRKRQWVPPAAINEILRSPTDPEFIDDLAAFGAANRDFEDPWESR